MFSSLSFHGTCPSDYLYVSVFPFAGELMVMFFCSHHVDLSGFHVGAEHTWFHHLGIPQVSMLNPSRNTHAAQNHHNLSGHLNASLTIFPSKNCLILLGNTIFSLIYPSVSIARLVVLFRLITSVTYEEHLTTPRMLRRDV